ncbi:hypothetical protein [Carnobacterium maltaromaticum]|uniref:hypothetical protein n=1 Tax=Carnobacterium maltaromaticum TaxID=2751 RepID=UPI0039BE2296
MPNYICNKNTDKNGLHEVHTTICSRLPLPQNQLDIGYFYDCHAAIKQLKVWNPGKTNFDGCKYCSPSCHTA